MNIEKFNLSLFNSINASDNALDFTISFAIFIANDLFYIVILLMFLAWFKGSFDTKNKSLKPLFLQLSHF
jgi:hypothetical protein